MTSALGGCRAPKPAIGGRIDAVCGLARSVAGSASVQVKGQKAHGGCLGGYGR